MLHVEDLAEGDLLWILEPGRDTALAVEACRHRSSLALGPARSVITESPMEHRLWAPYFRDGAMIIHEA